MPVADPCSVIAAPPDWASISLDITCPLCAYNLRGLTEPRCPECGYQFAWPDLLDPERRKHPYLFEDNPRRNISSFVRTFAATFVPRKFWSSLKPSHPPRPRRLLLYWVLASALVAVGGLVLVLGQLLRAEWDVRADRNRLVQDSAGRFPEAKLQALAVSYYPSVLNLRGLRKVLRSETDGRSFSPPLAVCLSWPFLTFATLMIFRVSMRRARLNTLHVLRCVIYGCNAAVWIGLLVTAFSPLPGVRGVWEFVGMLAAFGAVMAAVNFYHLGVAYRRYLGFDRPWATIAASQVIVWLVICVAALNEDFDRQWVVVTFLPGVCVPALNLGHVSH